MRPGRGAIAVGLGVAGAAGMAMLSEFKVRSAVQPADDEWASSPVEPRGSTLLGLSFRPLQAISLGLDPDQVFKELLGYPFDVLRLAAYWDRIETRSGSYATGELDRQIDAAEAAGKQIILSVGPMKNFGYPEFFVPDHHLATPLPEGRLVHPRHRSALVQAAVDFATHVVERYRHRRAVVAWQVEHDAVDPLGLEHSWRLSTDLVRREIAAVRATDPSRPVMLNGFLPTSTPVAVQQWWRTRDQGDSLDVAESLADIVGIDFYPLHALTTVAGRTIYLDGSEHPWRRLRRRRLLDSAARRRRQVLVSEGQAEPWETATTPPDPHSRVMFSCPPERLIRNYNHCIRWNQKAATPLWAYLFWGAEYWLARRRHGDSSYLKAFERVLDEA